MNNDDNTQSHTLEKTIELLAEQQTAMILIIQVINAEFKKHNIDLSASIDSLYGLMPPELQERCEKAYLKAQSFLL
ncbi:TPA: hypothetical protein I8P16_004419 [Salmonella enterica subsp. enterica serovar Napoli]|nr:hypothetical protein [Salmonella enterica subsp. enterica serovar Napoli]HBB6984698.1 hypothetical protein [Salmonella enterica subsp. enterica serovar Napoli]HBC0333587.1 hypothetical protein [Salmonella enterica subsp. enterica serovar Napoli]HBC0354127.1 hypothetical protein [Salmonella enterica subsp. enterica serovar Napoli]